MKESVIIIAEAGVNHNGDIKVAKQLVDVAAESGADYVKFQSFKAEKIASKSAAKAAYQAAATGTDDGQLGMLKKLELSDCDHLEIIQHCKKRNIHFLSTPFDLESIDLLKELGITIGKIPSGEITNLPYLRKMAGSFDELILSTGMADMNEIRSAFDVIVSSGLRKDKLIILHCNTEYPTPFSDVNLRAMNSIANEFDVRVGYSDHTAGIEVSIAATALGACLIEKHFTLDRNMAGPDHKASLEPSELKQMIHSIRNIEKALGDGVKRPSPSEIKNRVVARKSLVASKNLVTGHVLTMEDLGVKRPGNGISPMEIQSIVGKQLAMDIAEDEMLKKEHFV